MGLTGERSEKIRTYNYPQNRVTDHRIGLTLHKLDEILAFHTGKSKEEVHRDTERDRILGAKEAVEYGIADRVMMRRRPAEPTPVR